MSQRRTCMRRRALTCLAAAWVGLSSGQAKAEQDVLEAEPEPRPPARKVRSEGMAKAGVALTTMGSAAMIVGSGLTMAGKSLLIAWGFMGVGATLTLVGGPLWIVGGAPSDETEPGTHRSAGMAAIGFGLLAFGTAATSYIAVRSRGPSDIDYDAAVDGSLAGAAIVAGGIGTALAITGLSIPTSANDESAAFPTLSIDGAGLRLHWMF